ncbi:putative mitochondrial protein, partial [Mucuna pruriens]
MLKSTTACLYVLIYVNDIIITRTVNTLVRSLITKLNSTFAIKQLVNWIIFLVLRLSAKTMVLFYFLRTSILGSYCTKSKCMIPRTFTPQLGGLKLSKHVAKPELSYSVIKVCQFMAQPLSEQWKEVKRILWNIKGTIDHRLLMQPTSTQHPYSLHAYGGINFWYMCLSWSKKQNLVGRSNAEAEYKSLALAAAEILWIQSLLRKLQVAAFTPVIYCDNQSKVVLTHNHVHHSRTKHMELDIFFVWEKVLNKSLITLLCSLRDKVFSNSQLQPP